MSHFLWREATDRQSAIVLHLCSADDNLPTDVLVYLAPEVVQALRLGSSEIGCPTKEGDVYAFGYAFPKLSMSNCSLLLIMIRSTVLFELFTGKYPCSDATAEDVMTKVIQGFYTLMAGSMLLRNIKAVVATCWALDPCSRPSFKALLSGLTRTVRLLLCFPLRGLNFWID